MTYFLHPARETARPQVPPDPLCPAVWEPLALGALIVVMLLSEEALGGAAYEPMNWLAPIWLMIVLTLGALRMVRLDASAVWASLYWFRLATAVYFGFGSLAPFLVNPLSLVAMNLFYAARPDEVFKLNLVVAVSTLIVLSTAALLAAIWPRKAVERAPPDDRARLIFGLLFAIVGYAAKFLIEVPMSFGAYSTAVPGAVLQMAQLSSVGLYLLALHGFEHSRPIMWVSIFLLALDLFVGALQFSKFAMLLPLIMFLLAWLGARMSSLRIAAALGIFVTIYSASQPFIEFGRESLQEKYGSIASGSLGERLEILQRYESRTQRDPFQEEVLSGVMRLSYVNAGAFAISRYDGGNPGPSLDYAFATLVPRFIWPEKPIITDIGVLFNVMATGNARSSSAPGYFADAYWADGWRGVVSFMILVGGLYTFYSRFALNVLKARRWLFFPLVLLAMKMGLRVDGALVSDIVGASVIWFWAYFAGRVIERPINGFIRILETRPVAVPR